MSEYKIKDDEIFEVYPLPSQVVLRGYVDHNKRISEMIRAGLNLENWRQGKYDYPDDDDTDKEYHVDPTRRPDYDLADASEDLRRINTRLKAKKASPPDDKTESPRPSEKTPQEPREEVTETPPVSPGDK